MADAKYEVELEEAEAEEGERQPRKKGKVGHFHILREQDP